MPGYRSLLAQIDGLNPLNPTAPVGKSTGLVIFNLLTILGIGLVLGLLLLVWARYYVRNKKRHHHHHHDRRSDPAPSSAPAAGGEPAEGEPGRHPRQRHRRRRRRRDHRPRNPTLGETGGLPAAKTEASPNPPL